MDGTCNAVMSAGVFTLNDYRTEGLQQLRTLPDKLRAAKEGHHEKVRSIGGWADGAKGWFVDALLIWSMYIHRNRCDACQIRLVG